ncbi:deoxyhypusine hydroxylase-B-like isoform X1 [Nymphaea colorata]|nr:deoxyhypusine hydroxylase-B-like isoform X1 [Nymphaea colorata]
MDSRSEFGVAPETERLLCDKLLDRSLPIADRFRALFSIRNLSGSIVRDALIKATRDPSNLLAHESAFALGQMQDVEAVPALENVLSDLSLHPIVRHEAAEALGAIGLESNIPILRQSLISDPAVEVRETCELALRRIEEHSKRTSSESSASPFLSVDPALPSSHNASVDQLRKVLLNEEETMYERYAALFALRNNGGRGAVDAIIASLGAKSALLRHEGRQGCSRQPHGCRSSDPPSLLLLPLYSQLLVAFVLGQLQDRTASLALAEILKKKDEHPMVRHEAAEALGSIADCESISLLETFIRDPEPIVSQSCEVALSILEFERCGKPFEFFYMQAPEVN